MTVFAALLRRRMQNASAAVGGVPLLFLGSPVTVLTQSMQAAHPRIHRIPQGWIGLALVTIFWPLNWALPGLRTAYLFFPLWLGYILCLDALVLSRRGSSQLSRSRAAFFIQFVVSAPAWWLFELLNERTHNWHYIGSSHFTDLEYVILCTINFSIVMPAVFESAELVRSFQWIERFASGARVPRSSKAPFVMLFLGALALVLTLLWPSTCYPLVWGAVYFIVEPLNHWLGRPNLLTRLQEGDWRPVLALAGGSLLCGFFWEMWNFFSYPKWTYSTPGVDFLHVFEMPLLGYGGYVPFALELYALRHFLWRGGPPLRL